MKNIKNGTTPLAKVSLQETTLMTKKQVLVNQFFCPKPDGNIINSTQPVNVPEQNIFGLGLKTAL